MVTDIQLKNSKPKGKDYTINVDKGLSLLVKATGSKLWRFRYSFGNKRCMISVGKYPQVSMKQARSKQQGYHELLEQGINPSTSKKLEKIQKNHNTSFQGVALEWFGNNYEEANPKHKKNILRRLESYVFPEIGKLPIKDIKAPMLFNIVESIQQRGYIETGKRVNGICSQVFRYGVAKGYCEQDLTQHYRGTLKTAKGNHLPTLTDPKEIGELLRDMDEYHGKVIVKTALLISPYIFVRPNELVNSKWENIDFEQSHWLIPAEFMKMNRDHLIPFPKQVKTLLKELYSITGQSPYIFPSDRDDNKHMSAQTVNQTLKRIKDGKYKGRIVSHGFRGMASTILNEHKFRSDVIEKQLAHLEGNKVRNAYNHAEYLEERTDMMQWYGDYLDSLKEAD